MRNKTGNDLLLKIREIYDYLEPAEKKVANYILHAVTHVCYLSIGEVAKDINVSKTTVNRFCKKIGFSGYRDFRIEMIKYVASQSTHLLSGTDVPSESGKDLPFGETISYVIKNAVECLLGLEKTSSSEAFVEAVQALLVARQVVIVGVGSSSPIALDAEQRLTRLGINCCAITDSHFQVVKASSLGEADVVIAISYSGRTADVYECLQIAKKKKSKIIAITVFPTSPIAEIADIVLLGTTQGVFPLRESVASRISQMAIIDILCAGIYMKKKDELGKLFEDIELFLGRKRL